MQEVDNIIRILKETQRAIEEGNSNEIKKLSDQTIHSATISQDADNIVVAVMVYSIGKIIEREHYREMPGWKEFYSILIKNLSLSIKSLEKNDIVGFRIYIGRIRNSINKIDENLSGYIRDVFQKAQINKAFKIYEHGLSSEKTASLLGISPWDLASYIGQSSISEARLNKTMPIKKRIKFAEDVLR